MSIVHGGNLEKLAAEAHCAPDEILDFSVNLNPCGQPEGLFQVWFRAFDHAAPYPEPCVSPRRRENSFCKLGNND